MNHISSSIQKSKIMNTTKLLLLLLSVFMISTELDAQSKDRFSIGPRGGINFSNVSGVEGSSSVTGLVAGLTSTYSFNENTGLGIDLLYSGEGYRAPLAEYRVHYLQLPISFNYFFGELGQRLRPKVYVGVAPAFALGSTLNEVKQQSDAYNKFQLSVLGGLGLNFRLSNRIWLNGDVRGLLGLADVRAKDFQVGDQIAPRTVQASLGISYGLAKYE